MSAVIVQCPSCQARFHLARERIPDKGARVRCSRCEHRFYVTATGDVSESKPRKAKGPDPDTATGAHPEPQSGSESGSRSASRSRSASQSGATTGASSAKPLVLGRDEASASRRKAPREVATTVMDAMRSGGSRPARPRTLGDVAPQEDADLDDPQFLFDESTSSEELPYAAGPDAESPDSFDSAADEEPSSAAFGDAPSGRSTDTDVTPQVPPAAPASAAEESSGSWLSGDDEAIPDIRAQRDELAAQWSQPLAQPEEGFDVEEPRPPARAAAPAPAAPASSSPAPARVEAAPAALAPREASRAEPAPSRYAGSGAATVVARGAAERVPGRGGAARGPTSLDRVSALVTALTAVALLVAGGRTLLLQQLRVPAGPERVREHGAEASQIEVLHLRDAGGHRVLAVRGVLSSAGVAPAVRLRLLDAQGGTLGATYTARPERLSDEALGAERLNDLLVPVDPALVPAASEARGFTVLIRDPPFEADRFALELG